MTVLLERYEHFFFPAPIGEPPQQFPHSVPVARKSHPLSIRSPCRRFILPGVNVSRDNVCRPSS